MSYSPEPGRDPRPAPWASPSTPDPQDTQRFEDAPPAGGTRVDEAVDVTPERRDQPADHTQPVPAHSGAPSGGHFGAHSADAADQGRYAGSADHGGYGVVYPDDRPAQYGDSPFGPPPPPPQPQTQPTGLWGPPPATVPPQRNERRGPGWTGVVAVGAGAALLSSLLTIGIAENRLDSTSASQTTSSSSGGGSSTGSSSSQGSSAPLVTNGAPAPDWISVARAVEPSVVSVRVTAGNGGDEGSGIVYDGKGHILTNHHVIAAATGGNGQVQIGLSDGRAYPATIVGSDPSTDLAVLQVKNPPAELKPASFADSGAVKVGDPVMAVGNPLGLSDTVTTGIISALNRPVRTQQESQNSDPFGNGQSSSDAVVTNAIQTDAAVNPGNSGGALVDANGRVIGVTSSIASLGSTGGQAGNIGLGFAIPSNEARDVADQLLKSGTVQHAFLGVTLRDGSVQLNGAQRQAAVIQDVTSGTAAAKGGLRSGDSVIAVNGQPLEGADSLIAAVRALHPGSAVTLTVVRGGSTTDLKITLGTRPASNG
jgi:putative serine protease PepD